MSRIMVDTVEIFRPGPEVLDPDSGVYIPGPDIIYSGLGAVFSAGGPAGDLRGWAAHPGRPSNAPRAAASEDARSLAVYRRIGRRSRKTSSGSMACQAPRTWPAGKAPCRADATQLSQEHGAVNGRGRQAPHLAPGTGSHDQSSERGPTDRQARRGRADLVRFIRGGQYTPGVLQPWSADEVRRPCCRGSLPCELLRQGKSHSHVRAVEAGTA
ncbi:DUF6093 family protein [Streptomyces sp. NPDC058145]|uniref:DUF6093 family protein n=1 Tax=Streptomyces sp. NPDC058145 TaxID=3346356 RepID=UPI0036E563DA